LDFLEHAFARGRPEDCWHFHYYIIRDENARPVLATFFTAGLWKEDMLSSMAVSRLLRHAAPTTVLPDRADIRDGFAAQRGRPPVPPIGGRLRSALAMLLEAIGEHAEASQSGHIVLRDLVEGDRELEQALHDNGYVSSQCPTRL